MHLQFEAIFTLPVFIALYVVLRLLGKVGGSYIGARLSHSSTNVKSEIA